MLIVLTWSLSVRADCVIGLKLCDQALLDAEAHIIQRDNLIDRQEILIQTLATQRNEAYEIAGDEAGRMPWYFWAVVGTAAGVVIGQTVVFK